MKNQKWILMLAALAMMAGSAVLMDRLKTHPRLGEPGIVATAVPGSLRMNINLPETVLDFTSTNVPESAEVLGYLPSDTSYAERRYIPSSDGFPIYATVVLMGADRTSIHNADYCLNGQGLARDEKNIADIPIGGDHPYSLPVSEWKVSGAFPRPDGSIAKVNGIYVFWFVADGVQTPDHFQMMKSLALNLVRTGVMQRWAYISYFSQCRPGQEDATFARMEKLIAASVPQFQLRPGNRMAQKN
jgi:hypothetical protein